MTESTEKINVLGLTATELTDLVGRWGGKPFRARQLMRWLHQRSAGSFDVKTDLAREVAVRIAELETTARQAG